MDFLRTPEDRFANLAEYPFAPHYIDVEGLRIHYVDEGAPDADPVLLLHGEPTFSYLYRRTIPVLTAAGHRVVAPDLVGFGRSDKPTERSNYTYKEHVDWMQGLLTGFDLRNVTVVGHDWGGLIGLRLAAEDPEWFARIVAAQTALPTGDLPPTEGFLQWQRFSQEVPVFSAGDIVQMATATDVPAQIRAGYDAPFPDEHYQAGAREFPMLVPISPDNPASRDNRAAWQVLRSWDKPFLTVFSGTDRSFGGAAEMFQVAVPGAKHQQHRTVGNTGHFSCPGISARTLARSFSPSSAEAEPRYRGARGYRSAPKRGGHRSHAPPRTSGGYVRELARVSIGVFVGCCASE